MNDSEILRLIELNLNDLDLPHPCQEDTWQESHVDNNVYDCNIFSRKEILEQEDDDEPDVVADVYPTTILDNGCRDTDTSRCLGRIYPKVEEQ